jgi:hypothetical protein
MTLKDPLSGIRPIIQEWSNEAIGQLTDKSWVSIPDSLTWMSIGDSQYMPTVRPIWFLAPEMHDRLQKLSSFKALEEAAHKSDVLSPMLGCLVGTGGAAALFQFWNFAGAFLPVPKLLSHNENFSFEERYKQVSTLLATGEVEHQTTFPLQGVIFAEESIELSPGLSIEKLSEDEIGHSFARGLLQPIAGLTSATLLDEGSSFGLKKRFRLPLVVRPQGQAHDSTDSATSRAVLGIDAAEEIAQLQQCLALMTNERISVFGSMTKVAHPTYLLSDSNIRTHFLPTARSFGAAVTFDENECQELRRIWTATHSKSFSKNRAITLALRRLTFGTQRTDIEDRLLDVFIAAEALYLSDTGDVKERGDLRFRLALRAAWWSEGTLMGWSKRDVFKLMKTGYDARSAVAHGGTPKPKDIVVRSSRVSLMELVKATEDVVRAGLYKALRQLADTDGQLVIPWEDLALGD